MPEIQNIGVLIVDRPAGPAGRLRGPALDDLAGRVARRLGAEGRVQAAELLTDRPSLAEPIRALADAGAVQVFVIPARPDADWPAIAAAAMAQQAFPQLTLIPAPPAAPDRRLEDWLVEQTWPLFAATRTQPADGAAIEKASHAIIARAIEPAAAQFTPEEYAVLRRVIHATADVSFRDSIRFAPGAAAAGAAALRAGRPVICDVRMLAAGCTHGVGEVICAISDPAVMEMARRQGITRAAAAMRLLGDRLNGAIIAIGNAPTALWTLMKMAANNGPRPAAVIGMPVGFVGAYESKLALSQTDLPFITNLSPRGGSPAAAAAVNALADLARAGLQS